MQDTVPFDQTMQNKIQQRLQIMLGASQMEIAVLGAQLTEANIKIEALQARLHELTGDNVTDITDLKRG